jgi:biopolymer transport protein ExbD/biopolymer transport protein TolR
MAFTANTSAPSSEINVMPLIDVLLVLLIIFMVIVPVTPHGLDTSLPQGKADRPALPPVEVRLSAGDAIVPVRYRIGTTEVAYADLRPRLRDLFALRQDRTLFVQADRSLSYREVAAVVGEARQAGAGTVALSGLRP